jgi:hypothetical protein
MTAVVRTQQSGWCRRGSCSFACSRRDLELSVGADQTAIDRESAASPGRTGSRGCVARCGSWRSNSTAPHLTQPAVESSGGCSSLGARTRVKTPKRFSTATMPAGERNESSTAARSTRSTECTLGSFAVRLGGGMKAHEAVETFTKVAEGTVAEGQEKVAEGQNAATQAEGIPVRAAVVVAVLAAFLAIATFLSNESVKAVITGETKAADTSARLETNNVKDLLASSDSTLLRVVGTGNPKEAVAVAKAEALETRIKTQLVPIEGALRAKIATDIEQRNRADSQHLVYELSETGLQIGIVLAGISILARRRWLLAGGGLVGLAGIALLLAGLIY